MLLFCTVKDFIGAKMSKLPGPSRIPTFGTRIPQFGSASKPKQPDVERAISSADLGKTVVAVGKVGILRFVGKVHFASGVWCGIELETDAGKNDGCIDGIRYFICSRGRGLMTPLSKVSFYNPREKQGISHSRSSDTVKFTDCKSVLFENNQECVYKKDDIVDENKVCEQKFNNTRPNLPQILNRERTFDKIGREGNRFSKNVLLYDKNDNKSSNEKIYLKNNNSKKEVFVPNSNGIHNFRTQPEHKALENPVAACSTSENGNSLLLVETFSQSGTPKIETCQELYEKKFSSQITEDSINKSNKTKENVELTNTEIITKKPTQILDFKDRITAETSFTRNISSCSEVKEQSSESHNFRTFIYSQEEENKRDSLDLDESLEILSTSQMNDGFSVVESIFTLDDMPGQKSSCHSPLPSSNFDLILHENAALLNDTTINLDLPLDTIDKSKTFGFARLEETPSPEELPLDPIPIVEPEPKTVTSKSKIESKTNSFITSITSITSLDTGYQGDGEMSRPGSRGADNSPLTRRPLQRPAPRRTDAMTDSDFFTESDADNHDENVLKGDRKAQVIDGTLYGVDPQAAADIYVNNRENMDSSGVFTDLESNTRAEELLIDEKIDISPSDTSSKTLSENSQNNLHEIIAKNLANNESTKKDSQIELAKKRGISSPVISNTSSTTSPLHLQREDSNKKYKTLKREVQSKVKILLETNISKSEKKILKKPVGRWDAVMNKISKSDSKTNFQEVKSRVFNGANSTPNSPIDAKKLNSSRLVNGQKSPNNKLRRVRTRVLNSPNCSKNNNFESINSSLSDLSASTPKKPIGSAKKRDVQQVTQVLTAAKLSPKLSQQTGISTDGKRRSPASPSNTESKTARKSPLTSKEKKQIFNKENGRSTVKADRTSPAVRTPPPTKEVIKQVPKTSEALAILIQHLVFTVGAFEVPHLKRQVKNIQLENEDIRLACQQLEEELLEERHKNAAFLEEERMRFREDVEHLIENHRNQIAQIINQKEQSEEKLLNQCDSSQIELRKQYEEKLSTLKREFERLQKTHEESLDILREENEAIREDIDAKNEEIRDAKHESIKLREDYEAKESLLKEQIQFLSRENHKFKQELASCKEEISKLEIERIRLLEENKRLFSYGEGKGVGVQEVESLRVVLELKQNEVSDLRKTLAETSQKAESLAGCEEKAALLQARCEDLQLQLERKNDYEMMLVSENKKLEQSIIEETNQRRSLALRNEELQWKLKQNKEVITKILEQTSDDVFNKSGHLSSSFNNERYNSNTSLNISFKNFCPSTRSSISSESAKKLKKTCSVDEDESPPPSPKIKAVVEKSDSVSYVLDLDESPEVVASRLVRRSFRNSLNQKNTPTKSPCNKRPRMKGNPLSQSSSASSLASPNKVEYNRSSSATIRMSDDDFQDDFIFSDNSSSPSPYHYSNLKLDESPECRKNSHRDLDYLDDHVLDLTLPALPSELGCQMGVQALPRPKHLAGEAMVSESNSDDESTSSSSGQL